MTPLTHGLCCVQDGKTVKLDMESEFLCLALDIIGLGVFNYDFGSVTTESPVIKAVYRCLREAVRVSPCLLSPCGPVLRSSSCCACVRVRVSGGAVAHTP